MGKRTGTGFSGGRHVDSADRRSYTHGNQQSRVRGDGCASNSGTYILPAGCDASSNRGIDPLRTKLTDESALVSWWPGTPPFPSLAESDDGQLGLSLVGVLLAAVRHGTTRRGSGTDPSRRALFTVTVPLQYRAQEFHASPEKTVPAPVVCTSAKGHTKAYHPRAVPAAEPLPSPAPAAAASCASRASSSAMAAACSSRTRASQTPG